MTIEVKLVLVKLRLLDFNIIFQKTKMKLYGSMWFHGRFIQKFYFLEELTWKNYTFAFLTRLIRLAYEI